MKTTVKYMVLKSKDYQLGTPLFEESLDADSDYFTQIPAIIHYQNHAFQVKSKELVHKQIFDDFEESQTILVKVIALAEDFVKD
ncbi:hypothetical protein [Acinetobacter larvae]|uniref:Uncharacterized protein n=1 Tax=Acinetobacter larvae TaxID=1789224 RepID=A0A1B2M0F7_9GAMM|nr:hypothetical protein [Acinetobacter larvae]AOA58686.1 hypothetical protein BFG52_10190 [Acinetobacter larvae]